MNNSKQVRKSNFELMRIISILMVIAYHILIQPGVFEMSNSSLKLIIKFIECILIVHVNSFVITTGYFQCENKFSFRKFLYLVNITWFYKVIALLIVLLFDLSSLTILEILKNLSPINYQDYWFMASYVLLYLVSPILNRVIKTFNKNDFLKVILLLIFIISILPTFTGQVAFYNSYGFSLSNFILLYFIGSYLRIYLIESLNKKYNLILKRYLLIIVFFLLAIINTLLYFFGNAISGFNIITKYISELIISSTFSYDNPIVILQTVVYFLFFSTLKVENKIINLLSKTTLGIYLIHNNLLLVPYFYKYFGISKYLDSNIKVIVMLFINCFIIFILCLIIESIRILLYNFLLNNKILSKNKTFKKSSLYKNQ